MRWEEVTWPGLSFRYALPVSPSGGFSNSAKSAKKVFSDWRFFLCPLKTIIRLLLYEKYFTIKTSVLCQTIVAVFVVQWVQSNDHSWNQCSDEVISQWRSLMWCAANNQNALQRVRGQFTAIAFGNPSLKSCTINERRKWSFQYECIEWMNECVIPHLTSFSVKQEENFFEGPTAQPNLWVEFCRLPLGLHLLSRCAPLTVQDRETACSGRSRTFAQPVNASRTPVGGVYFGSQKSKLGSQPALSLSESLSQIWISFSLRKELKE